MIVLYVSENTKPYDVEVNVRMLHTSNDKMRQLENLDGRLSIHDKNVRYVTPLGVMRTQAQYVMHDLQTGIITIRTPRSEYLFKA